MKRTPDSMTVMNDHPVEFPLLGEKSVRDDPPRLAQSLRGKQVLDRLLTLLSSNLESQPTSSVSPFPPSLLYSICDALQQGSAEGSVEHPDAPVLPSVLSKLRIWRLLDPAHRHSPEGMQNLARDLASIIDEPATSADHPHSSDGRLRMRWVSSDSPVEIQGREPPPSPSCALDETQEWAHAQSPASEHSADDALNSCQADALGVLGFEHAGVGVSGRHRSVSTFRSGCAACRHPRVSNPSTPRTPQTASFEQRTLSGDRGQCEGYITPPGRRSKTVSQNSTTKSTTRKTQRDIHKPLRSISHRVEVDENEPPLPRPVIAQQVLFPRQRTRSPPVSNFSSSEEPSSSSSTSSSVASTKGILQPSRVPNRTREDDKRTFSQRIPFVNVDLRLPIGASRASPMDLHSPTRAQSLSYTLANNSDHHIHPHGPGSVNKVSNPKQTKNLEPGSSSRSSKRPERLLPFWHHPHPTTTTTSLKPALSSSSPSSSSSSLLRSTINGSSPAPSTRSSNSSARIKSPRETKEDRPSVSSRTSTPSRRSTLKFPSPPLQSRKWLT